MGFASDYDISLNPSTLNEFASTVYYVPYTMFGNSTGSISANGETLHESLLSETFNAPVLLTELHGVDNVLRFKCYMILAIAINCAIRDPSLITVSQCVAYDWRP
ncbi:unnamed protein product [Gongylonema pulchrum]|uniref:Peptidase_M14 domain-containing protein n=1 Tax=Gongylonema pulchrum TaxID=637853 RepID=A0A183ERN1_9BILA|nr:unnamed protein product [Gongylonema pulchrum]